MPATCMNATEILALLPLYKTPYPGPFLVNDFIEWANAYIRREYGSEPDFIAIPGLQMRLETALKILGWEDSWLDRPNLRLVKEIALLSYDAHHKLLERVHAGS